MFASYIVYATDVPEDMEGPAVFIAARLCLPGVKMSGRTRAAGHAERATRRQNRAAQSGGPVRVNRSRARRSHPPSMGLRTQVIGELAQTSMFPPLRIQ